MTTSNTPQVPFLNTEYSYRNYVDAHFLRLAYADGLLTIVGGKWVTAASINHASGDLLGGASYAFDGHQERLVRMGTALCHLIQNEQSLVVRVAAGSSDEAEQVIAELRNTIPELEPVEREVPARFWWWTPSGPCELARSIPYEPWDELQHNYAGQTHACLSELNEWSERPPQVGRLILWHGVPGTGKTSAIRTLAGQWQSWANFQFVTDPEEFLRNPSYLLGTVTGASPSGPGHHEPWKVIVLEDSGEFLMPDAKRATGQALSRLLNVCDGVLGMAMRVLVLITTNEPLSELHSALTRPGRCLAEISFESFAADEIVQWCARQDAEPLGRTRASLAELYAHRDGHTPTRKRFPLGFAAAA
jgi:hypothetical protein